MSHRSVMLAAMQTIETYDLVSASFEACAAFAAMGDGSPVCAGCGWLEAEHDHDLAEVRSLPTRERRRQPRAPKRLAS